MKNISAWLTTNNLKFREVTMSDGKNGIMVDTNYDGEYPTKETYRLHSIINEKCKRFKNIQTEQRGHFTALLIVEK